MSNRLKQIFTQKRILCPAIIAAVLGTAATAQASLSVAYQFSGQGNWSIDAIGGNGDPVGTVSALVPTGSTVQRAFLYSAQIPGSGGTPSIEFNGTTINSGWTYLGANNIGLDAYRVDVTGLVSAAVGGGSAVPFNFGIRELAHNTVTDGELLAVVYSNPADQQRTIAIMDGFSNTTGDSFQFNFANPLNKGAGFEAQMSLGIGFSFQGNGQYSQVDVNGARLTTSAGGQDDGQGANGALITAGGLGDNLTNPANPFALPTGPSSDDELYEISNYLNNGDTSILVRTLNPSADDNIFFTGFNITAEGNVTQPSVPDGGSTLALLGLALLGLVGYRRNR